MIIHDKTIQPSNPNKQKRSSFEQVKEKKYYLFMVFLVFYIETEVKS